MHAKGQFWFDAASVSGWHAPSNGRDYPVEWYGAAAFSLPINISANQKIVAGGYYENRELKYDAEKFSLTLQGIGIPITWLIQSKDTSVVFTATMVSRLNGEHLTTDENLLQFGGAILANFRVNSQLRLKAGCYFNKEFFSDYWVPLAGIELRINDRNLVSGTFPNSARFEHRFSNSFYMGVAYKSITNSYRLAEGEGYVKILDNHFGIFADYYFTKHLVGMVEAGHTLLRETKIRNEGYTLTKKENSLLFKAGIIYRIRMDSRN
ncbi:MAG: hypothetical protein IPP34_12480 [Bacteroidetes bacterium]|nr:hypothetical protein [Bacteroidota bacterium]